MGNQTSYYSPSDVYESDYKLKEDADSKNVLVLCQRKEDFKDAQLFEVNETIRKYATKLLWGGGVGGENGSNDDDDDGSGLEIEYLTDLSPYSVYSSSASADYDFKFGENEKTRAFVKQHKDFYSLIIFQTCPFFMLEDESIMKYIHSVLKDDEGILVVTAVTFSNRKDRSQINLARKLYEAYPDRALESKAFKKFFIRDEGSGDGDGDERNYDVVFKKKKIR